MLTFWATFAAILFIFLSVVATGLTVASWVAGYKSFRKCVGKKTYWRVLKVSTVTTALTALTLAFFINPPIRDTPNFSNYETEEFMDAGVAAPTDEELAISREEDRKSLFHEVDLAHETRTLEDPNKSIDDAIERANKRDSK